MQNSCILSVGALERILIVPSVSDHVLVFFFFFLVNQTNVPRR